MVEKKRCMWCATDTKIRYAPTHERFFFMSFRFLIAPYILLVWFAFHFGGLFVRCIHCMPILTSLVVNDRMKETNGRDKKKYVAITLIEHSYVADSRFVFVSMCWTKMLKKNMYIFDIRCRFFSSFSFYYYVSSFQFGFYLPFVSAWRK